MVVNSFIFEINQRVRVKTAGGGNERSPSENAKGRLGTIVPQLTQDWAGTRLELEPGTLRTYYVTIDGGTTELISGDWLDRAGPGE